MATVKTLWRISNHVDLGGWGGRRFASRWTSLGRRVVFLAESPAGAMLEVLAHLKDRENELPRSYTLIEVSVPEQLNLAELMPLAEVGWKDRIGQTQQIGDAWLLSRATPLARVPSAIVPQTWNVLLNPEHPEAKQVRVESVLSERFDYRLFRFGGA